MGEHRLLRVVWAPEHMERLLRKWLAPVEARAHNRITTESIIELLDQNLAQLWIMMDEDEMVGAVVTEISQFRTGKRILQITAAGGDFGRMKDGSGMIAEIEEFGRQQLVDCVTFMGRKGWGRVYPGYEERFRVYEKEIEYGRQ